MTGLIDTGAVPLSPSTPYLAGGEGSSKPPIVWWRMESMQGAAGIFLQAALLPLFVHLGWITVETAGFIAPVATGLLGLFIVYGRANGGAQPSPMSSNLFRRPDAKALR